MKLEDLKDIDLDFTVSDTGSSDWNRVFIRRSDGCTIGRLSFCRDELTNIKWYKKYGSFDESDWIQAQFTYWLTTGSLLTRQEYDERIKQVEDTCHMELEERKAWRRSHPAPGRPRLTGKDVRRVFHRSLLKAVES